jgi:choline kinase
VSKSKLTDSRPIKCIILAAGASMRLRPLTDSKPKCLLKADDKTLLERTIKNLLEVGIKKIAIVVGYRANMIREFVNMHFPDLQIQFILNPDFAETNNSYSLMLAHQFFADKKKRVPHDLLLLDSDILFSAEMLSFFMSVKENDKISIRRSGNHNEEEILVKVDAEGNIILIGKGIPISEAYGESIGIEAFSAGTAALLFKILGQRTKNAEGRKEFYETSFQEIIDKGTKLKAIDISRFPTIEIDTPDDLERAKQMNLA